jgi:hypothetical protein
LREVELYPHKIDNGDLAAAVQDLVDISSQRSNFFPWSRSNTLLFSVVFWVVAFQVRPINSLLFIA